MSRTEYTRHSPDGVGGSGASEQPVANLMRQLQFVQETQINILGQGKAMLDQAWGGYDSAKKVTRAMVHARSLDWMADAGVRVEQAFAGVPVMRKANQVSFPHRAAARQDALRELLTRYAEQTILTEPDALQNLNGFGPYLSYAEVRDGNLSLAVSIRDAITDPVSKLRATAEIGEALLSIPGAHPIATKHFQGVLEHELPTLVQQYGHDEKHMQDLIEIERTISRLQKGTPQEYPPMRSTK